MAAPAAPQPRATGPAVDSASWWRIRMMWLVIGGPLAVVVASFATLALAIRHPDPVLSTDASRPAAERPAVEMRNHAATAVPPPARP